MKVSELIEKLKQLPQDVEVVIPAADYGANPVELIRECALRNEHVAHWAFGQYVDHGDAPLHTVVLLGHSEVDMEV